MSKKSVAILEAPTVEKEEAVAFEPNQDEIAVRAHELFLQRGGISGHELEDWLQAEEELRKKNSSKHS